MRIVRLQAGCFALGLSREEAVEVVVSLVGQLSGVGAGGSSPFRIASGCGIRARVSITQTDHLTESNEEPAPVVVRGAIRQLLRSRDFLGYQLSHANGSMSDAQFEEVAREHLTPQHVPGLEHRILVLRELMEDALDSDELGALLGCAPEEVQAIMATQK